MRITENEKIWGLRQIYKNVFQFTVCKKNNNERIANIHQFLTITWFLGFWGSLFSHELWLEILQWKGETMKIIILSNSGFKKMDDGMFFTEDHSEKGEARVLSEWRIIPPPSKENIPILIYKTKFNPHITSSSRLTRK